MRNKRLLCAGFVFVILSATGSGAPAPQPGSQQAPGLLGMDLASVQRTEFFRFFNLAEVSRSKDAKNRAVVNFKPGAKDLRSLVTVQTTQDSQGRVMQVDLYLARTFIAGNQAVLANDISRSMLLAATPVVDRSSVETLGYEIYSNEGRGTVKIIINPTPKPPVKQSPGYLTYLGRRHTYTQELSVCILHMENLKQNDEEWLQIRLSLK